MQGFLDALNIISQSWPIAFFLIAVVGGLAVRRTSRMTVELKKLDKEAELEQYRMKAAGGTGLIEGKPKRTPRDDE